MSVISPFPGGMLDNAPARSSKMASGCFPGRSEVAILTAGLSSVSSCISNCDLHDSGIKSRRSERNTCFSRNAIPTSIWSARHDGSTAFVDDREFHFNHPCPFPNEREWSDAIHPEDLPRTLARWSVALRTGQPFHDVHRGKRRSGQYERVLVDGVAIRDEDGGIVCWIGAKTAVGAPEVDCAEAQPSDTNFTGSTRLKQTPDKSRLSLNQGSNHPVFAAQSGHVDVRTGAGRRMVIPQPTASAASCSPPAVEPDSGIGKSLLETVSAAADAALFASPQSLDPKMFRDSSIKALLQDLSSADRIPPELACLYSHSLCVAVLARIGSSRAIGRACPQRRPIAPLPQWRLARVIQYIGEHMEESIKLADLAKAAGLTRMHFAA
jgi:hypothetical protein